VSPPFTIGSCDEARLVFSAGALALSDQNKAASRKQNKRLANTCSPYGSVQLKASEDMAVEDSFVHLHYSVGGARQGPYELETRTLQGCDLSFDWREQVDDDDLHLRLAVEMFQVSQE